VSSLLVLVPLRVEQVALGKVPGARVLRTGMGPERARIAAARALADESAGVAVAGLCAGVAPALRAGDVVCATELIGEDGTRASAPGSSLLAGALRRRGLRVHLGALYSAGRILGPGDRRSLPEEVLGVDMESAWLAAGAGGRPFAVVRVVVDTAERRLADPSLVVAGPRALRSLRRVAGALAEWSAASTPEPIVGRLVAALAALGPVAVVERTGTTESIRFRLPREPATP
jgi:4-hydroxy-3-methylbut-2-enyl diphosphate reductase